MSAVIAKTRLRDATLADLPTIVAIFNAAVPSRSANAELQPVTVESRRAWFDAHSTDRHPLWVAEYEGEIVGWIGLAPFLPRAAYFITAELSVYLSPEWQGRGLGSWMLGEMLAACPRLRVENVVSLVFAHNIASLRMNEKQGFTRWGYLPEVTLLDGIHRDVVILGRKVIATE